MKIIRDQLLFKALKMVCADNDMPCDNPEHDGGSHEGDCYFIVPDYVHLVNINIDLVRMSDAELDTLCTGEETEQLAIVEKYGANATHQLINDWFNGKFKEDI